MYPCKLLEKIGQLKMKSLNGKNRTTDVKTVAKYTLN